MHYRLFKAFSLGAFAAGLACGVSVPTRAQTANEIAWCNGKDNATPDQQVKGCTAMIQSGKFAGNDLALVFRYRCWGHMMLMWTQNEKADNALSDCTEAMRLNPNDPQAATIRGSVYYKAGDYDRAIQDHSAAIKLDPKNIGALNQRGLTYLNTGAYELAARDFTQSIQLNRNINTNANTSLTVVKGLTNRCLALGLAGQTQAALADCNEALKLGPDQAGPVGWRAFIYLKNGNLDSALADYEAALRLDPKGAYWLYGRGMTRLRKGDRDGNADIAAAKTIKPEIAGDYARYGVK